VLLSLCAVLFTSTIFVSSASWILFAYHNGFITRGSLISTLADLSSVSPFFSLREFITLVAALALAAASSGWLIAKAPFHSIRDWRAMSVALATGLLVLGISFHQLPHRLTGKGVTDRVEGIVRAQLLPTATIFWAPVMLGDPHSHSTVAVPLERSSGLNAYAASIERKRQRPNILVFAVEALRAGEESRTVDGRLVMPTLARLARKGSTSPVPTRRVMRRCIRWPASSAAFTR